MTKPVLRGPELPGNGSIPPEVRKLAEGARGSSQLSGEAASGPVRESTGLNAADLIARVPDKDDTRPLHVRIPKSLHKQLKVLCGLQAETMTEVVTDLLRAEVKRRMERFNRGD